MKIAKQLCTVRGVCPRPLGAEQRRQTQEILEHGRTGWLYSSADPGEPAATIRAVAQDRAAARRAGAAARELVLARHTWERNAEQVETLARRALA
jgi:glycosyltransferase involved in cell wall biosynthesis